MPTSATVRVAVVGAGVMGRYHAMNYLALPRAKLVGIVDPSAERRAAAHEEFGCDVFGSVDELLLSRRVDAVSVAVPTSLHYQVAKQLLLSGVHVLVEKPVATDVGQARELAELSRSLGLVLQVGHITRFYQSVEKLRHVVKAPYLIEARRLVPSTRVKDVGVILDLMIHDIDIVLGLVPDRVLSASAVGHALNGSPHEDVAAAQVVFENGCIARLLASRVAPDAERSLLVAERHQTIRVDFAKEPYTEIAIYKSPAGPTSPGHVQLDRHVLHEENPLQKELGHFIARQLGEASPIGTLNDDLRSLGLASRLQESMLAAAAAPV
ncbi:MAG TPA: Gfo/Idh/MocA family oxidoreductase [Trueperaceae bacterium]|nr:Gfo/Idh/MocA family oxidoreductase [Trueperaceae bacterium]